MYNRLLSPLKNDRNLTEFTFMLYGFHSIIDVTSVIEDY